MEEIRGVVVHVVACSGDLHGADEWVALRHRGQGGGGEEVRRPAPDDEGRAPKGLDVRPQVHLPGRIRVEAGSRDARQVELPAPPSPVVRNEGVPHPGVEGVFGDLRPDAAPVRAGRLPAGEVPGVSATSRLMRSAPSPDSEEPGPMSSTTVAPTRSGCRAA